MSAPPPERLRALVLAAGRGERLRPLTLELPKPLLPVAGRPLVAWTLERLRLAGCRATAINLHHLGQQIRGALGDSYRGMPLAYSDESAELLGTGGALAPLEPFLTAARAVLVINGDSLCRWPLDRLLREHRRSGALATLLVHASTDPRRFGGGIAIENGRVAAFRSGALAWQGARKRRVFAGAAALAPELARRLPAGPSDIVSALYEPMLAAGEPIAVIETRRAWFDLGTPARYLEAALAWGLTGLPARGARLAAGVALGQRVRLDRVVVEAGARIGAGAWLRDSLVLSGATVGAGARLERTIVGPGVELTAGAESTDEVWTVAAGAPGSPPGAAIRTPIQFR